jgi:AcrR family transcriptional regulator
VSRETSRDQILQAALDILGTDGHAAMTVRKVADRAGCSTIGVYTWFGGRDGLVDAILLDGFASFGRALSKARTASGRMGKLVGLGRAYRKWALAHPTYYEVMFMGAVPGHAPTGDAAVVAMGTYTTLLDAVKAAQAAGELRSGDAEAMAMIVWAMVHGLVSLEIAEHAAPSHVAGNASLHKRAFDTALEVLGRGLAP